MARFVHRSGDQDGWPSCDEIRGRLLGLLDLLGSEEKQRDYQGSVEWIHTPTEMICMFLDDLCPPDSPDWVRCFSSSELGELANLRAAVEAAAKEVSHEVELDQLLTLEAWQRMMGAARRAHPALEGSSSPGK